MLLELTITNIALIDSLTIEFDRGFNVLTGETGAGKSIVVDSVNLALGGRADRDMIRTGSDKGMVQALFDISCNENALTFAEQNGFDAENGLVSVTRELSRNGRNVCRISGIIVPLNMLKQFTGFLVDVHGQHEHQALMNPARHMDFLDNFAGEVLCAQKQKVSGLYGARSRISSQLKKILNDVSERERLFDILNFQLQEIQAAHLKPGEEEKLNRKLEILENSEKIRSRVETAYAYIYQGSGKSVSVQEALMASAEAMDKIASLDPQYGRIAKGLREMYYQAQDIGYELQALMDGMNYDPELLDKVATRLELFKRLERKYGETIDDVIRFGEQTEARLNALKGSDASIDDLKKQYRKADADLKAACADLTEMRRHAGKTLAGRICTQLADLGMGRTRFEVRIEPEAKPTAAGMDCVEFMISPNPGEPLRPLAAIASGGEISRIMLALKVIAMDSDGVDSMVFDEIDTGVSGRMAQVVGEKMCLIAQNRQVLCVTHLPQIAALGDTHFQVAKSTEGERTHTDVIKLDRTGRVGELSRLVGGAQDSESSLSHAAHMLNDAIETKDKQRKETRE